AVADTDNVLDPEVACELLFEGPDLRAEHKAPGREDLEHPLLQALPERTQRGLGVEEGNARRLRRHRAPTIPARLAGLPAPPSRRSPERRRRWSRLRPEEGR